MSLESQGTNIFDIDVFTPPCSMLHAPGFLLQGGAGDAPKTTFAPLQGVYPPKIVKKQ